MFAKLTKAAALRGAVRVLELRAKVLAAIEAELKKLQSLIQDRRQVERAVIAAETAAALGESADPAAAHKQAEQVAKSLDKQAGILSGLRTRIAAMAGDLETERRAVSAALPEYEERVKSEFSNKWARGVATFSALLGERQALESLIGRRMELPEPQPAAVELPEMGAPWNALEQLTAALEQISGWSRAAAWPEMDSMLPGGSRPFDPTKVYVLTRPQNGIGAGEAVVEASFEPGTLAHLVNIGYAVAADADEWQSALNAGSMAAQRARVEAEGESRRRTPSPGLRATSEDVSFGATVSL